MLLSRLMSTQMRTFLSITKQNWYQSTLQACNLAFYACLSIYAVINLGFLFHTVFSLSALSAVIVATMCVCFVMVNELINIKIVSNPIQDGIGDSKQTQQLSVLSIGVASWLFACFDNFLSNSNMLTIQIATLARGGVFIPAALVLIYRSLLIGFGLLSFAMTAATNWLCFLCNQSINGTSSKKHTLSKSPAAETVNDTDKLLYRLIHNPFTMWTGMFIGGFLYAYGDYQQAFGLFIMLAQSGIMLPGVLQSFTLCSIATITFVDRILIWSNNYRQFSRTVAPQSSNQPPFAVIPKDPLLRSRFSHSRLVISTCMRWLLSFMCLRGHYRLLSVLSCSASAATSYVQNSFQIADKYQRSEDHRSQSSPASVRMSLTA